MHSRLISGTFGVTEVRTRLPTPSGRDGNYAPKVRLAASMPSVSIAHGGGGGEARVLGEGVGPGQRTERGGVAGVDAADGEKGQARLRLEGCQAQVAGGER